jgi:GMP synthase (glutamine-hydrolysing)
MHPPSDRRKLSRRAFLRLAGLGTLLAACGSPQAIALPAPTLEPSATPTPTATPTLTATATHTPTATPTDIPTATATPSPTPTATLTPTPTPTRGPLRAVSLLHGPARSLIVDHALERFGVLPTQIRVDLGETVPDLRAFDAVIFAGGEYRPEEFDLPIFQAERERIMEALEANVPILAICLGHQLLADWLGGEVKRGRWEIGWLPITVNEAGQADPILSGLGQTFYGFLWHGDQVTRLPEEAILLASSELCRVQAYRLRGRPVWSLQFNPQYDPAIAESVTRHSPWIASRGWDQEEIIATGHREYDDVIGRIFGRFFELILKGEISHASPGISAPGVDLGDLESR